MKHLCFTIDEILTIKYNNNYEPWMYDPIAREHMEECDDCLELWFLIVAGEDPGIS